MTKQGCIINPATGRAVKTTTPLGKKLMAQAQQLDDEYKGEKVLKTAAKRALAQKEAGAKNKAGGVLAAAAKRAIAKKPEPPKAKPPKKFGFEDLDEGVKGMISKYVRGDSTFEEDKKEDSETFSFARWVSNIKKRLKTDINSKKDIDYVKEVSKKRYGGGYMNYETGYPVLPGIKGTIIVKTYTRKERVEKLSDLSKEVLDKKGGMKHYPLLCFTIKPRGYGYLGEDHYINNPPIELWIRGKDAETCFKDGSEYAGVPYFLFPDGYVYETDLFADTIFEGTLTAKKNLFGNDNLKIKWGEVDKKDRENSKFDKVKSKYLPNFDLPKI